MSCDKETLVGYIYDELEQTERETFERHLAGCDACREEVAGLRATRAHLARWSPPEPDFALPRFRVDRDEGVAPRSLLRLSPAWGLAAAAVLLLAVASAIANLEIRYGAEGLVVRTGWSRPEAAAPVAQVSRDEAMPAAAVVSSAQVQQLEQRVRDLETRPPQNAPTAQAVSASSSRLSDEELMRQVRGIVNQSESRQQRELALRLAQVVRDFDVQRQSDLVRVQQGLQQMQGLTDAELIRHRDALNSLNYMVRVAQQTR